MNSKIVWLLGKIVLYGVFLSGCLLLPELKFDLSQVHNSHHSFAWLTAPYPSAFIHWGAAGFGFFFFSFYFGSNSQEFQHLYSTCVSKKKRKKTTEFLPAYPRTDPTDKWRLVSFWCKARRGDSEDPPRPPTLPIKGLWIKACFSDPTASIQPSWIDAADLDWAAAELLGAATALHSTEYF